MKIRLLSKARSRCGSKRSGVVHVSDAKIASFYEEADFDVVNDDGERQPEKTLRLLSSSKHGGFNHHQQQQQQHQKKMFLCNKCGKGFQSSKALCGHMACHSVKEKPLKKNKKLLIMDSQSETESEAKNLRKRSMTARYKKLDNPVIDSITKLDGYTYSNCSSEPSEVEQEEQEHVAISLMMLSRDSWTWSGMNSIGDSSDNNSVTLEAGSVSTNLVKLNGMRRSKYDVDETLGNSECSYVRNGAKKIVTDVKFDDSKRIKRNKGSKAEQSVNLKNFKSLKKPKMKLHSRISNYSAKNKDTNNAETYERFEHEAAFKGNETQLHDFIDLNLPAPMEEEDTN